MVYVTGDTHRDIRYFTPGPLCRDPGWGPGDKVIVTGDFGFVMEGEENSDREKYMLDELGRKDFEILFVDGNHEGFPYLEQYPEELRYGAPVRRIRRNIFWLQRGYVYIIEGMTFLTLGGAASMDKAWRLSYCDQHGIPIWFEREIPSDEELDRALESLRRHGGKVDYIITHTAPKTFFRKLVGRDPSIYDADVSLTRRLYEIYCEAEFTHWFLGHFHVDQALNDRMIACMDLVHRLPLDQDDIWELDLALDHREGYLLGRPK
jgi:hypothetical protein